MSDGATLDSTAEWKKDKERQSRAGTLSLGMSRIGCYHSRSRAGKLPRLYDGDPLVFFFTHALALGDPYVLRRVYGKAMDGIGFRAWFGIGLAGWAMA